MTHKIGYLLQEPEGARVGSEELGVMVDDYKVFLWNNENVLRLFVIIAAQLCEYTKINIAFNYMVCVL